MRRKKHGARPFALGITGLMLGALSARGDAPLNRYTIGADTVFDAKTHLTWQRAYYPSPGDTSNMPWSEALGYCAGLGGGWRLPTVTELQSILDYSNPKDEIYDHKAFSFVNPYATFWTSTSTPDGQDAYVVRLTGHTVSYGKGYRIYQTLCVK